MTPNITIATPPMIATRSAICGETGIAGLAAASRLDRAHERESGLSPPVV